MPRFLLSLAFGAVSGIVTYLVSGAADLALIAAAVVTVLFWHGIAALLILDN